MLGATYAGLAFSAAGTAAAMPFSIRGCGYAYNTRGGRRLPLPWVMQWNRPAIAHELTQMAKAMNLPDGDAVIPAISALFARISIPPHWPNLALTLTNWTGWQNNRVASNDWF